MRKRFEKAREAATSSHMKTSQNRSFARSAQAMMPKVRESTNRAGLWGVSPLSASLPSVLLRAFADLAGWAFVLSRTSRHAATQGPAA